MCKNFVGWIANSPRSSLIRVYTIGMGPDYFRIYSVNLYAIKKEVQTFIQWNLSVRMINGVLVWKTHLTL